MGDFKVRAIKDSHDSAIVYQYVMDDIKTLECMIREGMMDEGHPHIGAEQEICIVRNDYHPATNALEILDQINDPHYTNELALFNLEANLDPELLEHNCFRNTEHQLLELYQKGVKAASDHDSHLVLTGILPTLKYRHLKDEFMTPIRRYKTLSDILRELRGSNFEIYLQGTDDIIMSLGSVLFEACNTSFQLHFQTHPRRFASQYNWAQMISGPVLSACVNSPILFGRELWAETRIALFKQSLDTRSSSNQMRRQLPRVFFGKDWLQGYATDLWKQQVMHFPLILASDDFELSSEVIKTDNKPNLRAAQLHNGTTYTWNRLCYGTGGEKPHIRIECRYLPAGPTLIDEMANFVFWIGLMAGQPEDWEDQYPQINFKSVKDNFIKAARNGLDVVHHWYDKKLPAGRLILEVLLPLARKGLKKFNINEDDINKYLYVFERRVEKHITGSDWLVQNSRKLEGTMGLATILKELTKKTIEFQKKNIPLYQWDDMVPNHKFYNSYEQKKLTVEDLMSTDLYTVRADNSIAFALEILEWENIHHLPVEDSNGEVTGLLTDGILHRYKKNNPDTTLSVDQIMIKDVITIPMNEKILNVTDLMARKNLKCLPVTYERKLVGILTNNDLTRAGINIEVQDQAKLE